MATGVASWIGFSVEIGVPCSNVVIEESKLQDINASKAVKKANLLRKGNGLLM
jgi:hypothetical protein